ncbi:MAG: hypothetical protein IKX45_08700 [Bacteroidales bacterium]|nr:hypothetical protein [Bacteroidales bacterium]
MRKETMKRLPYEAPEVGLVKVDPSCSLMQDSIVVPTALGIPDIEEIEIDWVL